MARHIVDAENQTWVLCKNSKHSTAELSPQPYCFKNQYGLISLIKEALLGLNYGSMAKFGFGDVNIHIFPSHGLALEPNLSVNTYLLSIPGTDMH